MIYTSRLPRRRWFNAGIKLVATALAITALVACGTPKPTKGEIAARKTGEALLHAYVVGDRGFVLRAQEGFRVTFPVEPRREPGNIGTARKPIPVVSYSALAGAESFWTNFGDWGTYPLPVEQTLHDAVGKMAEEHSGKVEFRRSTTIEGHPAVNYLVSYKDGFIKGEVIIDGKRLYHLFVGSPERNAKGYERFVGSFTAISS